MNFEAFNNYINQPGIDLFHEQTNQKLRQWREREYGESIINQEWYQAIKDGEEVFSDGTIINLFILNHKNNFKQNDLDSLGTYFHDFDFIENNLDIFEFTTVVQNQNMPINFQQKYQNYINVLMNI